MFKCIKFMHLGKGQTPAVFAQRDSIMNAIIFSKKIIITRMSSRRKQPRTRFCAQMFYCFAKFLANSPVMLPFLSLSKQTNPQKSNHPNQYLVLELPDEGHA